MLRPFQKKISWLIKSNEHSEDYYIQSRDIEVARFTVENLTYDR